MDASKITREEGEADDATSGLVDTCRLLARMFTGHAQMYIVRILLSSKGFGERVVGGFC